MKGDFPLSTHPQIQKGTWEWLIAYRDVKYAIVQKTVKMHKTVVLTSTLKI